MNKLRQESEENCSQEMVIDILNKDFSSAGERFNNEIMSKIETKLDAHKLRLAQGAVTKQGYSSDETDN